MKKLNLNADDVITSGNLTIGGGLTIADTGFLRLVDDGNGNVSLVINGEAKPIVCIISGTWEFHDHIEWPNDLSQSVKFATAEDWAGYCYNCTGMRVMYDSEYDSYRLEGIVSGSWVEIRSPELGWLDDSYRTIIFSGEQEVDKEFLDFMKANAVKMITFTAEGKTYTCPAGMTWGELLDSDYPSPNAINNGGSIGAWWGEMWAGLFGPPYTWDENLETDIFTPQTADMVIVDGADYFLAF